MAIDLDHELHLTRHWSQDMQNDEVDPFMMLSRSSKVAKKVGWKLVESGSSLGRDWIPACRGS